MSRTNLYNIYIIGADLLMIMLFPPFSATGFVVCIILAGGKINWNERYATVISGPAS
jgi:hypothetical protein